MRRGTHTKRMTAESDQGTYDPGNESREREVEMPDLGWMDVSERHRLLSSEDRRLTLGLLAERTGPVDLEELATALVDRRDGGTPADEAAVRRAAIALHHRHLPLMADRDAVAYDPDARRVVGTAENVDRRQR